MSARDELARTIRWNCRAISDTVARTAASAIIAAGYRKPRTITTHEELEALPEGSAVLDGEADVSTKHSGEWHGYEMNALTSSKLAKYGPFTVLFAPEARA